MNGHCAQALARTLGIKQGITLGYKTGWRRDLPLKRHLPNTGIVAV